MVRAVVQRVRTASVRVDGEIVATTGRGLLALVAAAHGDGPREVEWLVEKLAHLRIFEDDAGKMNRSLLEVGGEALIVSQFTLYGDTRKGRRPRFLGAARPEVAEPLIEALCEGLRRAGVPTQMGRFGAHMIVSLENDGPVTLILDSPERGSEPEASPGAHRTAAGA